MNWDPGACTGEMVPGCGHMALTLRLALWEPWASPAVLREDLYLVLCPGVTAGVSGVKMGLTECKASIFNTIIPAAADSKACSLVWVPAGLGRWAGLGVTWDLLSTPASAPQHQHQRPTHLTGAFLAFFVGVSYFWLQLLFLRGLKTEPRLGAPWLQPLRLGLCSVGSVLMVASILPGPGLSFPLVITKCPWGEGSPASLHSFPLEGD